MNAHVLVLLAAHEGGSFSVSPNLGLILWTLFMFVLVAAIAYAVVRLAARGRRGSDRR